MTRDTHQLLEDEVPRVSGSYALVAMCKELDDISVLNPHCNHK